MSDQGSVVGGQGEKSDLPNRGTLAPLLSVVTRHWPAGRAESFKVMKASVEAQTLQELWDWVFIIDRSIEGMGVVWADAALQEAVDLVRGEFVWLVDDDDWLEPRAVETVCRLINVQDRPDVIVVSGTHGICGVLPTEAVRVEGPIWGQISGQNVVVSREMFARHAWRYADPNNSRSSGDIAYVEGIWADKPKMVWVDEILVHQQRNGFGRPDWEQ